MNKKLISLLSFLPLFVLAEDLPSHKVVKKGFGFMDRETFLNFLPDLSFENVLL